MHVEPTLKIPMGLTSRTTFVESENLVLMIADALPTLD